ncbi:SCP2 sterol-binding domain-containing protein [Thalassospira sp. MA62]|nr:SCP2 sterol-binding domain-containing protein [Thalassospira sp. MA62]
MSGSHPSFTPFLLISPFVRNAPKPLVRKICRHAITTMFKRHKAVFERVSERESFGILIAPTDLDLQFMLEINPDQPDLRPVSDPAHETFAARISGPLPTLLELLQGKSDGDALFFSRTLRIEGRTDLVVALRNALDGEEIDLMTAVSSSFGVAGPIARIMLQAAEKIYRQVQHDMDRSASALTASLDKRLGSLESKTNQQTETISQLEKSVQRGSRRSKPAASVTGPIKDDFAMSDHP